MRKNLRALAVTTAVAFAGFGSATVSPGAAGAAPAECPGGFLMETGIGCTKQLPNGNKLVHHEHGVQTETHGGDHAAGEAQTLNGIAAERPVACADTGARSQAIYAYTAGTTNRLDGMRSQIQAAVRSANGLLAQDATETGVVADFRFACDSAGQPLVTAISTTGSDYSSVVTSAQRAGLTSSTEDYWIFADFASPGGYSGVGTFYGDDTLSAANANYRNAGYGITYSGYWGGTTPMHEHGHNMGAVQNSAPDSSGAGHCDGYGSQDVMCYNDGGAQWDTTHACGTVSRRYYDACHNDYFHTSPAPGSYLAGKHNIGANRSWAGFDNPFLAFGSGGGVTPTPTPVATTSTFTGGIGAVATGRTHTFSALSGSISSTLKCSGGKSKGSAASLRQEVLSPAGALLGSLDMTCDGVARGLVVTSTETGPHTLRITKTAGANGTTSYTATVSYTS